MSAAARRYLDASAAAPMHPAARAALLAALDDGWADPRRLHAEARRAAMLLDASRQVLASTIGARPDEVDWVASHVAAVHAGVLGLRLGRRRAGPRVLLTAVEHSAVHAAARHALPGADPALEVLDVDRLGHVDLRALVARLADGQGVALACVQHANGEIGTVQRLCDVVSATERVGVPLLVDAGASLGHLPPPQGWSVLTGDAHAWGGPPGVGVLAVRTGVRWRRPWPDDGSAPRVPGEVPVPWVVAAAAGLAAVDAERAAEGPRRQALVEVLRQRVMADVPDVEVHGDAVERLPHVLTFSCLLVDGEALVDELDRRGFAVGSGSACTASALEPSHVLAAVGALTHGNVRVGLPVGVDADDVAALADALPSAVAAVRRRLGTQAL